ncbi:hydrophobic/amphiphilic exporter-1, HAE1 family [Desulfonauticus submarinus]|uniref:Hydrophobic/amphiphilic exporter-1, HAE1 family n=1 Tax=Desulfonauticus submarinus TaxID=206665 RepID=A0A1G9ZMC2_9BACT|nr:efflux RND transporter permease subunit [Desulfonauticus submarinus]SDN22275.1 hydrophobic/amphiphilic exporter-1, HAE1 family [Desulfonauticus submarinus]
MSRFFLKRPVFAWVIAIAIMSFGLLGIKFLPVSQYPELAPPMISVEAFYPGASAETVESTVTQIIEQKLTGLDGLWYISAKSSSSGQSRIDLTFAPGTDPDIAWSKVQNKVQLATASLPDVVQQQGVRVSKSTKNYLLILGIVSNDGKYTGNDLKDYAKSNIETILARIPGVGEVEVFGTEYAMRIWLNPDKLNKYNLTIEDIVKVLKSYNVEVSAGQLGGAPSVKGQRLNAVIIVQHYLQTPEEFYKIPIKIKQNGSSIYIKDVAKVELGTERYDILAHYNGKPSAFLAIRKQAGTNSLEVADKIKEKMEEMSKYFPQGVKVVYPYDTTPFTKVAIHEVVKTLYEAIILVFIVMFIFLGSFRATIIPTIAVPVVVLGTFGVIWVLGFSINMLTMFAMVLAIGLLVDDAIVVVENVDRIMEEQGLSPREAALKSMEEISGALIGIGLVLSAVFLPMAFFPGSTGIIYRQFSVTIAAAMLLSVIVALILTPVLCATILKPKKRGQPIYENTFFLFKPLLKIFNKGLDKGRNIYISVVGYTLEKKVRLIFIYIIIVSITGYLFLNMKTGYLPNEDQGILLVQAVLPSGSTLEQTEQVMKKITKYIDENEKNAIKSFAYAAGMSFGGQAQNVALGFISLKDWNLRQKENLSATAIAGRLMRYVSTFNEARVFAFLPPAIIELGNAAGFDFELLDYGGGGYQKLMQARNKLLYMAMKDPRLIRVRPNGMDPVAEYKIDVDWEKAGSLKLPIQSINLNIAAAFGGMYVNNFVKSGRVKKVYLQYDAPYRMLPEDLKKIYIRNIEGKMVPFSSFAKGRWIYGPQQLERYNGFPSINIWGEPAPGYSSGDAMKIMEELVSKLPKEIGYAWTGLSYQEKMATNQGPLVYAFAIFVIFLVLAALYESWPIPIAILLSMPLGVIGGIIATNWRGFDNDVYFQIGLITTLGLTTKNAILIVQFARERVDAGYELIKAVLEAAKLRLRPILMTSFAFGFGVLPLAISNGAGAGAQNAIGTVVLGGTITSTFLATLLIPLFYVLIYKLLGKYKNKIEVKKL